MVEYPSIKDIQHPLECGTPSEMLHCGLEYHCAEYDVLVQKCTKNIISHYTISTLGLLPSPPVPSLRASPPSLPPSPSHSALLPHAQTWWSTSLAAWRHGLLCSYERVNQHTVKTATKMVIIHSLRCVHFSRPQVVNGARLLGSVPNEQRNAY